MATARTQPQQRVSLGQSATVPGYTLPSNASNPALSAQGIGSNANPALQLQQQQQQQQQQLLQQQQGSSSSSSMSSSSSSSIVNATSLALALPHSAQCSPVTHVDAQALHYLTTEMAPVLRKSTRVALRRRQAGLAQLHETGLVSPASSSSLTLKPSAAEVEDETVARLESIGAHVGANLAERASRDRVPFQATLDVVKFICKDIWTTCFEKQVDNLRTNHRGVYVLQDNHFRPLLRLSTTAREAQNPAGSAAIAESESAALARVTRLQLAYPSGVIRGALARLGVPATVVAETNQVPQCTFHVKTAAQQR